MSCDYEDIAYDAYSTDYCPSVAAGELLALKQMNAYYAKCPESAIVLSGYSEGATVMGNVLAGDSGDAFCPTQGHAGLTETTSGVSCNIAAVTLFGNPRHSADQPYNVLSGAAGQANSHRDAAGLARLAAYTPRLHDYCNVDDLICAVGLGANTVDAHTNYFQLYSEEAAQYIAGIVKGWSKDKYCAVATSSSSSSSSASATSSASSSAVTSVSASASASASGNASSPATSAVSSPASVPYITATELTSIYTTVCPQSSIYSNGNMTRTSVWTGPSAVTTSTRLTTTTTVAATYIPSPSSIKESAIMTLSGTPAVVQYTSTISTTTYANFPTLTITLAVPTATFWLNGQGASNSTQVTGVMASGSGVGAAHPTGSVSSAPIAPYTGAASSSGVAAKWLAVAAGVAGLMMI
jgi:acetylxylan esterase